jgi:transglutaminase/protease-like cytokinesis protein 3|tara:strand:+ start:167 stop:1123 length:957 start_codon:yes stop_codon:yes gene_type:complete
MKKIALIIFLSSSNLFSQDLLKVDKIVFSYPKITSVEQLVKKIDYDFKTKLEKARATYTWLALNIKYYKKASPFLDAPTINTYTDKEDKKRRIKKLNAALISKTIRTKKALCKGYAYTFKKVCDLLKIENQLIFGYAKYSVNMIDFIPKSKNHVWNAIKIDNKWLFVDATWGSNNSSDGLLYSRFNEDYFDISHNQLNTTHFPKNKFWLDFTSQKELSIFCRQPIYNRGLIGKNIELLSPKEGKIIVEESKNIQLKIKNLHSKTEVLYSYGSKGEIKKADLNFSKSIVDIYLTGPKKDANLNIYFNNELAIQYKVEVR